MAVLVVVPLGYYFSLDRFSEVQQALRNPAEKTATPQNAGQSEDRYVLKIQQRLRQNPNNAED